MPDAVLGAGQNRAAGIEADQRLDLFANPLRLRRRQVDFIDHRNDFEIVMQRQISIRQRLRLYALRCVNHKQRAFASLQTARNFVRKIDVARRIDQIELILNAAFRNISQSNGVRFDGDAALALQIHRVENLRHHLPLRQGVRRFEKAIGQRRLAVIDMRDDTEISDELGEHAV